MNKRWLEHVQWLRRESGEAGLTDEALAMAFEKAWETGRDETVAEFKRMARIRFQPNHERKGTR